MAFLWITVNLNDHVTAGFHNINLTFESSTGNRLAEETFELEVLPSHLPEQELIHTQWFHADNLATYYNVEVFSEEHWQLIEKYVETAANHGINMILTPLFTPPLDTEIGKERPTVQLVDVEKVGGSYYFQFEKLTRWIMLCQKKGITYFEFSHLFTQWGAKHAPKIIGREDGKWLNYLDGKQMQKGLNISTSYRNFYRHWSILLRRIN